EELIDRLVAEIFDGEPDESFQSEAMKRGVELEDEALAFVNFATGYNFKATGFFDSGLGYGYSPDGEDSENDIDVELKCPLRHTHLKYLSAQKLPSKYFVQMQFGMMVTGRKK